MKLNKKALAILTGLTLSVSGTAFAAEAGADSFSDVPQGHWAYDALDFLAKDGVIEGMGDGTFQGNRTMTRYEMASIVAKAMQKGGLGIGDQAVLDKLAGEYGAELATLKKQTDQNTKDIDELKKGIGGKLSVDGFVRLQYDHDENTDDHTLDKGTNRFYMNINGAYKVNDNWTAKFQSETNRHYNDGHHRNQETGFSPTNGSKTWSGHDGNMQRIWVEGYNPKNGSWISIGRAWRGLGFQNVLFGNESDGVQFGMPIKGTHLTGSGFWLASTGEGKKESIYGVGLWGAVGHNFDINLAYGHSSRDKGEVYSSGNSKLTVVADPTSASGYAIDTETATDDQTNMRDYGWVASIGTNLGKNFRFLADYSRTNADFQNDALALRLNYKGTDLKKPGSFGLYTRYIKYGQNGWLAGDDEWNSIWNGTKGWIFGVKYVPWTNVEWETLYSPQKRGWSQNWEYKRNLVRTQVDFHF
jgi:hypothetical protein